MPPRASRRLSLRVLPAPERADVADLEVRLRAVAAAWGAPPIGAANMRVDVGSERFVSSGQGGFAVACPTCAANVVGAFVEAVERWRAEAHARHARALECPSCGARHDLDTLRFDPPAGFARGWIALDDVEAPDLPPAAARAAEPWIGAPRVIAVRG